MHEFNCPCGSCGRREAAWHSAEEAAIAATGDAIRANMDDLLRDFASDGCDAASFDGDRDNDFSCAVLRELLKWATERLMAQTSSDWRRRAEASWIAGMASERAKHPAEAA